MTKAKACPDAARVKRVAEKLGRVQAAAALGVAYNTLLRVLRDQPVSGGSRALVRLGLAKLAAEKGSAQ